MKYADAWVRSLIVDDVKSRLVIPSQAVKAAAWNLKNPVYIKVDDTNHLTLTQDGSDEGICGTVHGYGKQKQLQISTSGKFDPTVDEAVIRADSAERKIYIDGISWM